MKKPAILKVFGKRRWGSKLHSALVAVSLSLDARVAIPCKGQGVGSYDAWGQSPELQAMDNDSTVTRRDFLNNSARAEAGLAALHGITFITQPGPEKV